MQETELSHFDYAARPADKGLPLLVNRALKALWLPRS